MWVDMDRREVIPGPEQAPIEMEKADVESPQEGDGGMAEERRREKGERGRADRKRKDCFAYGGGNTGGSSSESEVEQQDRQRQMDQWNLKRPGVMEPHVDAGKRQRNT